jgi:hypothetical protein
VTRHKKSSARAVTTDTNDIDAGDWNSPHLTIPEYVPLLVANSNTAITLTPSAAANTEMFSTSKGLRRELDLSQVDQFRLRSMVIANGNATGASLKMQYDLTETATWSGVDLAAPSSAPETGNTNSGILVMGTGTVGVLRDTGWVNVQAAAQVVDSAVTVVVGTALGTTAPTVGSIVVAFRKYVSP